MVTATRHFDAIQLGMEATKGTLVPATRKIPCSWTDKEEQLFYRSDYPRNVRATRGGAGVITKKGMNLNVETELSPHDILWPLLTGVKGQVTGVGAVEKVWTFSPELTTAELTLDTATVELIRGDGTTNHFAREFGYAITRKFGIEWAVNEVAKLKWEMFGRASQTSAPTAALSPYTNRKMLVTNLLSVFLDTTWAGLGGTQLTGLIRSANFECVTGLEPDFTADGRSDLDMTGYKVAGPVSATLGLVMEFNSSGAARSFTDYRANTVQYIRLESIGEALGGSNYGVVIDGAYRFVGEPAISYDGDTVLVATSLEAVYDETGTKILEFAVTNDLAAVA